MAKDIAVVLNNGSLNSAVTTAIAVQKYRPVMVYAELSSNPGSRARAAYEQQVAHFKPYREHMVNMPFLAPMRAQSDPAQAVDPRQTGLVAPQLLDLLPLVAVGARYAGFYQASALYVGLRIGPGADDLLKATEFFQVINELLQLPCNQPDLEVNSPLLELEPWQVVDVGCQVEAPLDRGWSCLEETPEPCWICRGCRNREAAFQQAGKPDPLRMIKKL
jgi:7-cyano-7-deazaguanine synthase